jgi:beta-hydroxylase
MREIDAVIKPIEPAQMGRSIDAENTMTLLRLFGRVVDLSERLNVKYSVFGNPPIYDSAAFPWAKKLEDNWRMIRTELDAILPFRDTLPNFQDICADVSRIQQDNDWKTFFLYAYGLTSEANCRKCAETARLLKSIPGMKTAFFSILSPGKHIPPHRGPYNGVLRYHLGLRVPEPRERVRIRIANEIVHWEEGKSLIFDDAYNHEVWNDTDAIRAVLFVDFLRPVRFPASLLQRAVIKMATWTPFVRAGRDRHERWEKKFYRSQGRLKS